jgi:predicted TIM-barrel fold metal-dependent hydrolase
MATYAGDRSIVDIDSHILEPVGWLRSYAVSTARGVIPELGDDDPEFAELLSDAASQHQQRVNNADFRKQVADEYMAMSRKGWMSLGGWDPSERTTALDQLGFAYQVVFPTASFVQVAKTPIAGRAEAARAMNRGLKEFCVDSRLLATAYVPFEHGPDIALEFIDDACRQSAAGFLIDSIPSPHQRSFTHPDFDVVWNRIQDSGIAVFLHVGADQNYRPVPRTFFDNGRNMAHVRSDAPGDPLSFMGIGYPAELFLASLIYDGVMEKFPGLRFGVTELGATWLPSFLHFIDTGFRAFRNIQDLSHLKLRPSEYLRRQVVVSPFAGEDVGWVIEQAGADMVAFSSDYPHHEGTNDPIKRFEASMPNVDAVGHRAFYDVNARRLLAGALN